MSKKNLVTPFSIAIVVHFVEFHRKSESKVYLTMRAGRDYHWQPQTFATQPVKVRKDVEPRRADFNGSTLLGIEKPAEDVVEVELHQKGGVSSGIWARAKIDLSKLPANAAHQLKLPLMNSSNTNHAAATAHMTVTANGFGVALPVQQVVHHTTETVYVPTQQPQMVVQQTHVQPMGAPMGQPMGAPMGQPVGAPMGHPVGTPVGQPMGQPMGQPQGSYPPQGQPMYQQQQMFPQQPYMTNPQQQQQQPYLTNQQGQPGQQQPMYYPQQGQGQPQQQMYQPQGQPMMSQQGQPMMQPQGQPQGQPMMQPQGQPMMQPQGQPMMQPQGQPMMQPQGQYPQGSPMPGYGSVDAQGGNIPNRPQGGPPQ